MIGFNDGRLILPVKPKGITPAANSWEARIDEANRRLVMTDDSGTDYNMLSENDDLSWLPFPQIITRLSTTQFKCTGNYTDFVGYDLKINDAKLYTISSVANANSETTFTISGAILPLSITSVRYFAGRDNERYDDIQGKLETALTGITSYTFRQYRSTGLVYPYIANNDIFTYTIQFSHRKKLGSNLGDFHLHWITEVDTSVSNGTVLLNYAWGWYNEEGTSPIPAVLPNTGQSTLVVGATDRYYPKLFVLFSNIQPPANETYSSMLYVKVQRVGGTFGNTNEIAIRYVDAHFLANKKGSYNTFYD